MIPRDRYLLLVISVALFFIGFRVYNLENPFSTNGIDEGIHLLQAKMVDQGYNLYTDLNGDQAPVAILTASVLNADVMAARLLSFLLFGLAAAASAVIAWVMRNKWAAVYTLLIVSLDFTLLRESRLFSLDLFSAALLTVGVLCLVVYLQRTDWRLLLPGAGLISLACLAKLMAAPVALVVTVWFAYALIRDRNYLSLLSYVVGGLIPVAVLLILFSPEVLIDGLVLRQATRLYDWGAKASVLLFLGPSFIYLSAVRRWDYQDKRILLVVLWLLSLVIFIMVQGLTFQHHFAYAAFPAAILAGMALTAWPARERRIAIAIFVAINAVLGPALILTAPDDMSHQIADTIEDLTPSEAVIISGDPLVTVLADRRAPPNMTNLAYYHQPPTTAADVLFWLETEDVAAVVLYWKLSDLNEIQQYLNDSSKYVLFTQQAGKGQILFDGCIPAFSRDNYTVYLDVSLKPGP
jgi:4-amino-4-deoxy-L-arabinose transferase-like glycosyltransferase